MAAEGVTTLKSRFGPEETMNRLETEVRARGMTVFAHSGCGRELWKPDAFVLSQDYYSRGTYMSAFRRKTYAKEATHRLTRSEQIWRGLESLSRSLPAGDLEGKGNHGGLRELRPSVVTMHTAPPSY